MMSPDDFGIWLDLMVKSGRAKNKGACARLMGRTPQWVTYAQQVGTDTTVALACAALLAGLAPFKAEPAALSDQ
jgi:hypothetical protein